MFFVVEPDKFDKIYLEQLGFDSIDKRMQDHAKLFNALIDRYLQLEAGLQELRESDRREGTPNTLAQAFKYIRSRTGKSFR